MRNKYAAYQLVSAPRRRKKKEEEPSLWANLLGGAGLGTGLGALGAGGYGAYEGYRDKPDMDLGLDFLTAAAAHQGAPPDVVAKIQGAKQSYPQAMWGGAKKRLLPGALGGAGAGAALGLLRYLLSR